MILMFSGLVKHSKTKTKPYVLTTYNTHIYMWILKTASLWELIKKNEEKRI